MARIAILCAALAALAAGQPFDTFPAGGLDDGPPFSRSGPYQQPTTVPPTNVPTTTPAPVQQATSAPSIPPSAPAPSIQPQNNASSETSAGNSTSIAAAPGFIRAFGTYFVDGACHNFVPVGWNRCVRCTNCPAKYLPTRTSYTVPASPDPLRQLGPEA